MKKKLLHTALLCAALLAGMKAQAQTPGAALDFDGNSDMVSINHSYLFNFSNVLSLEAWINTTSYSENYIISKGNDSFFFAVNGSGTSQNDGKLSFYLNGVTSSWLSGNANVSDGNWHHVAVTYDNSTIKLYVDGVPDASFSATGAASTGTSQVYIGFRPLSANSFRYFQGKMDEVRFWSVARSQCEIQTFMNCEIPAPETGLSANYHFNQGIAAGSNSSVTILIDAAGSNTGTLNAFLLSSSNSNWVAPGGVVSGNTVTANSLTVNITTPNTSICLGESTVLTGSGAFFYNWANGGSASSITVSPSAPTIYTVNGTLGVCKGSGTVQINVSSCTGITENTVKEMKLFPNPANTVLTLSFGEGIGSTSYTILSLDGRVVNTGMINEAEAGIDISLLAPGLYYMKPDDRQAGQIKFIKQ